LWYPNLIKTDNWWSKQCPTILWNQSSINSSSSVTGTLPTNPTSLGTSAKTVVTGVWNQTRCLEAHPIYWWNITSWTMMIGYFLIFAFWLTNLIVGNNGGIIHLIFLWVSRFTSVLAVL
jgi:hypothetical protein